MGQRRQQRQDDCGADRGALRLPGNEAKPDVHHGARGVCVSRHVRPLTAARVVLATPRDSADVLSRLNGPARAPVGATRMAAAQPFGATVTVLICTGRFGAVLPPGPAGAAPAAATVSRISSPPVMAPNGV